MKNDKKMRLRALQLRKGGRRPCDIAQMLNISASTVSHWTSHITTPTSRYGQCEQCERYDQPLDTFRGKNLCRECMNPDEPITIDDFAERKTSPIADFEEWEDKPIKLTKAERKVLGT